ncbi:hypothetical protein B7P43_G01195 [Cryptotermes secundus]|uniref:Uncharacterized protein n=1 Tax=Cryptotermes secundus TaxID=105785 RepID=A0A2J7PT93_9NEOP|nr:hypothetical protein B7P43_G01195 [Cryptotermes secundus]
MWFGCIFVLFKHSQQYYKMFMFCVVSQYSGHTVTISLCITCLKWCPSRFVIHVSCTWEVLFSSLSSSISCPDCSYL